jgi:hypothetical protein
MTVTKEHCKNCDSFKPRFHGDMRNAYPNEMKKCNCDGYHTFDELYDHRITLYIALCRTIENGTMADHGYVWRSKRHSDGELCFGTGTQYVLGIGKKNGEQITYHIPIERWSETDFAKTFDIAPCVFDGHTSDDVLERLKKL